jgi:hypothetical protein
MSQVLSRIQLTQLYHYKACAYPCAYQGARIHQMKSNIVILDASFRQFVMFLLLHLKSDPELSKMLSLLH